MNLPVSRGGIASSRGLGFPNSLPQVFRRGAYGGPRVNDSAKFDGTNDFLARVGGVLDGVGNSKKGLFSAWVRADVDGSNRGVVSRTTGTSFLIRRQLGNQFGISGDNAAGTPILSISTALDVVVVAAGWIHVAASWDLGTPGAAHLYVNDLPDCTIITFTDDTLDYTSGSWFTGSAGANRWSGLLAEVYWAPGQYLDLSALAHRRRFIQSNGRPTPLGVFGQLPTGIPPAVFHHLSPGEDFNNFAINRGTGGAYSITGALEAGTSGP